MWLKIFKALLTLNLSLLAVTAYAYSTDTSPEGPSLGQMATGALGPMHVMTTLIYNACYVIGGGLIVSSGMQFKAHRDNSSQVPISRPIFLLIFGLLFIALPFIARLSIASAAAG